MAELPEHRPDAADLEKQPFERVDARLAALGEELAVLLGEVNQDGARLEDGEVVVTERRDFSVRVDGEVGGAVLLAFEDVHPLGLVVEAELLEQDDGLDAVGRRPGEELDHRGDSPERAAVEAASPNRRGSAEHKDDAAGINRANAFEAW